MAMDWDKLRVFHAVAEAGSFTHAGKLLHLSQSAVSRQVGGLEESLKATLFHRHARGLLLTEQGELLYRAVHDVFAKLAAVQARIGDVRDRPEGSLTVSTTVSMAALWLTPRLRAFLDLYPDIRLTLLATDAPVDLAMREADCAIRLTSSQQPDLVQRRLTSVSIHAYASQDYLRRRGTPETEADLAGHRLVVFGERTAVPAPYVNWLVAGRDTGKLDLLRINNVYGMLRAADAGLGIAALPDFMARQVSSLVRVLNHIEVPKIEMYFVYPAEVRRSRRLEVFRDYLVQQIRDTPFADGDAGPGRQPGEPVV